MTTFDPNAAAAKDAGIFGLPHTPADAGLVLLPVPWEATTSYGGGTSDGPAAILRASHQVDLYDGDVVRPYEPGIAMLPEDPRVREWNAAARERAARIIEVGGDIGDDPSLHAALASVNEAGAALNRWVRDETRRWLDAGKIVGLVGGDHAVPLGALQAIAERHADFGVLHFDAHSDTRDAYEGFTWSHASILRNALDAVPQVTRLVQVGIRDFCEEEVDYCRAQGERVHVAYWRDLTRRRFEGETWGALCRDLVARLPRDVWITFDIDGLDPKLCPHTGTPVPGGLELDEATYLVGEVVRSGRRILGFDLNEVSPGDDEWDANVGARLLYKLCAWTLASRGLCALQPR